MRLAEGAETLALIAKLADVDSIEREDLDASVERVAHKEFIPLHCQSFGEGELALPFALLSKSEQKLKSRRPFVILRGKNYRFNKSSLMEDVNVCQG